MGVEESICAIVCERAGGGSSVGTVVLVSDGNGSDVGYGLTAWHNFDPRGALTRCDGELAIEQAFLLSRHSMSVGAWRREQGHPVTVCEPWSNPEEDFGVLKIPRQTLEALELEPIRIMFDLFPGMRLVAHGFQLASFRAEPSQVTLRVADRELRIFPPHRKNNGDKQHVFTVAPVGGQPIPWDKGMSGGAIVWQEKGSAALVGLAMAVDPARKGDAVHADVLGYGTSMETIQRDWPELAQYCLTGPPMTPSGQVPDPHLDRALQICNEREKPSRIQVDMGPQPFSYFAKVSTTSGMVPHVYALAALPEAPDWATFQVFKDHVHTHTDLGGTSRLIYDGFDAVDKEIKQKAFESNIEIRSFIEYRGRIDFRTFVWEQCDRLANDPEYPPSLHVQQRLEWQEADGMHESADAVAQIREWLQSPGGQFIVLHGESGAGKTFTLRELARRMGEEGDPLVQAPALIEMRKLEKARALKNLVAGRFWDYARSDEFWPMLREGCIALLFDGFDELALRLPHAQCLEHLEPLLEAGGQDAKVVVSLRTQHFPSDEELVRILEQHVPRYRIARLCSFDEEQIRCYLENALTTKRSAARHLSLLKQVQDLMGLAANPRMLGFMAQLTCEELESAASQGAGAIYHRLIAKWLQVEVDKAHPAGVGPGLNIEDLWEAVARLALLLWRSGDRSVAVGDPALAQICGQLTRSETDGPVAEHQVRSRSLLVREAPEVGETPGRFRFIHHSVMEYLVGWRLAKELVETSDGTDTLTDIEPTPLMVDAVAQQTNHGAKVFGRVLEDSRNLLKLCAAFGPAKISSSVLSGADHRMLPPHLSDTIQDASALDEALKELEKARFISLVAEFARVHPVVRKLLIKSMSPTEQKRWTSRALHIVQDRVRVTPREALRLGEGVEDLPLLRATVHHAQEVGLGDRASLVSDWVSKYEFVQGRYQEAAAILEGVQARGDDACPLWAAVGLNNLAAAQLAMDDRGAAVDLLRDALRLDRERLPEDHLHLIAAHANLGRALADSEAGSQAEAVNHLLEAASLAKSAPVSPRTAALLDMLGSELTRVGRGHEAIESLRRAEDVLEDEKQRATPRERRLLSEDHPRRAVRAWTARRALNAGGDHQAAETEDRRANEAWAQALESLRALGGENGATVRGLARRLRADLEVGVTGPEQVRNGIKQLIDTFEKRIQKLRAASAAASSEKRAAEDELGRVTHLEVWSESAGGSETGRVDSEGEEIAAEQALASIDAELARVEGIVTAWRDVLGVFVLRCVRISPWCGLHPEECALRVDAQGFPEA